jgi:hypothetical protein
VDDTSKGNLGEASYVIWIKDKVIFKHHIHKNNSIPLLIYITMLVIMLVLLGQYFGRETLSFYIQISIGEVLLEVFVSIYAFNFPYF